MEIYTNSATRKAYLDLPVTPAAGTMTVILTDVAGHDPYEINTVTLETDGRLSIVVPYHLVQHENTIRINWSFSYVENGELFDAENETFVDVVSPILPLATLRSMFQTDSTDAEIYGVEASVRHIINAHTGQSFSKYVGPKTVLGDGSRSLVLPQRLMVLHTVNGAPAGRNFEITGGGYYLNYFPWGVPPVKADYYGLHMHDGGVIHNPNNVKLGEFRKGAFVLNGEWGYNSVPAEVQEAAKLLAYDYATQEVAYRDRYLTSMTAADWRIQFHSGAFRNTGNVRADQLLADHVLKRGWAVI